jgi:hypothetical protein
MRKLILAAFAIAAAVLLASFAAPPPSGPSQTLLSLDPHEMTLDRPGLPVAPATDAH